MHNNIAQANDVYADDAVVESSDGPIDASGIFKRIYSGILEGKFLASFGVKNVNFFSDRFAFDDLGPGYPN